MKKIWSLLAVLGLSASLVTGCGGGKTEPAAKPDAKPAEKKELKIGATAGPYSDMVSKAIKPIMEKKGYKIEVVEFGDYIQPNLALANGSLDANLFQHIVYLKKFSADKGLDLSAVISVPTAPMGLYSKKFKSLDEIKEGSTIAIANDPTNLARTLLLLQDAGLIKIKKDVDVSKASEKDIAENPKKLNIKPLEAAQLPRAVDSADLSAVPGNFALAAKMDLLSALKLENMPDDYRNQLVVKTKDLEAQFTKDLKAAIESKEFEQTIDSQFKGFGKPKWMTQK
ncbi:MetQ/NlpA family ABC transporter substrate-binding protein [Effusibacillus lacus]|uniref:Lipoprotein n=1 Tax=Effusibacillus lacus TaxID=1348429 RepID=A0A292YSC3_9BACL|nr:MetQ/NlpA family ABC transporter substrate-binding protein [Effusibacillus lacus]TCS75937.1 D-methionine transport system substrate-binding protein [Effusibacillus lacus]GAX91673.1 methionine ABC transporter ATPase [Effusibacillus lacus]